MPKLKRLGRLDIVMAVVKQMRPAAGAGMIGKHHRMAASFFNARREARAPQMLGRPRGGKAAITRVRGLGADTGDRQEFHQAGEGVGAR